MPQIDDWLSKLQKVRKQGKGYMACCPAHDDSNPSMSITEGDDGRILVKCFAGCDYDAIRAALGINAGPADSHAQQSSQPARSGNTRKPQSLPENGNGNTVYRYHYADSSDAFAVVRRDNPDGTKRFSQWTPVDGGWIPTGLRNNLPLFRLPSITGAAKVIIVEGEKCVHAVMQAWPQLAVTTWAGGSNGVSKTDWQPLAGKEISILSDADTPGRKAATEIAAKLHAMDCTVKLGLAEGETGEDVADWLATGREYAKGRIAALLQDYVQETTESISAKSFATNCDWLEENDYWRVMGIDGGKVIFRMRSTGDITDLNRTALLSVNELLAIAPDENWWTASLGEKLTIQSARTVGAQLLQVADRIGHVDMAMSYGRGAVRLPDGGVVYHLGDRLLANGQETGLEHGGQLWLAEPPICMKPAASDAQLAAAATAIMGYRWASDMDGKRFLGWITAAIVGGALQWRPHMMLVAPSGSGKSWLLRQVITPLIGPLLHRVADATPAAIARLTANAALPLVVDEAEPSRDWVIALLDILRIASGAEGMRLRADQSSTGITVQNPRFCCLFSSTSMPRMTKADASRMTHITLGDPVDDWQSVLTSITAALHNADAIRSRIIRDMPAIVAHADTLAAEYQSLGMDSREALSQASLTAGWQWWGLDQRDVSAWDDDLRGNTDTQDLINQILSIVVRNGSGPGHTLARALGSDADSYSVADLYGVMHDGRGLLIDYANPGLINALYRTPWANANLRGVLLQIPGVETTKNPVHVGKRRARVAIIPPDTLESMGAALENFGYGEDDNYSPAPLED